MPQKRSGKLAMAMIYMIRLNIKTWRKSQGKFTFVFTTIWVPLPSVCVTYVSDVYLYLMQSLPDGHVPGMRMDRGVSMPNMLEPKASADIIRFPSSQWRFDCEMQIKCRNCLSSLVFLYLTSVPAPFVPNLSLCSGLCLLQVLVVKQVEGSPGVLLGLRRLSQRQNNDTEDAQ